MTDEQLTYEPVCTQPYQDCVFEAGNVTGHPIDTLYLTLRRGGEETTLLLRPDEAQAIAWVLSGVLWSDQMRRLLAEQEATSE